VTTQEVIERFKQPAPVSLIRVGDGEKIVLDGFQNPDQLDYVLKRQLGFSPAIEHAREIRENLIKAIDGCNILGIPKHKNLASLGSNWRHAETTVDKFCPNVTKRRCSIDIAYDIAKEGFSFLNGLEELTIIGCRDLEEGFKKKYKIEKVNWYCIAPEAKFTSYSGKPHYPDQFIRVEGWMNKIDPRGKLLLVGAGVIGKIYCNWWRDMGGKAMDVGSMMDEWGGYVTRGPERFLDRRDLNAKYFLG
jgi:hypothetical protein